MKTTAKIILAAMLVVAPTMAFADGENVCTGTEDVSEMEIGCDGEATRDVSLAKCDFRADKVPNISLSSVIDGHWGNQSVTIDTTQAGRFTVSIKPQPGGWSEDVCKVWRFNWSAE